jgi:hypothetical protein
MSRRDFSRFGQTPYDDAGFGVPEHIDHFFQEVEE